MQSFSEAFREALVLLWRFDGALREIILLSLQVSVSAVLVAAIIGLPLGAWLAVTQSRLRGVLTALTSTLMGLPPVVVGLVVYLLLSNAGALGPLQLLYTPTAMIIAQSILVTPILIALTRETLSTLHTDYNEQLTLLGVSLPARLKTLLWEGTLRVDDSHAGRIRTCHRRGGRCHYRGWKHQSCYASHDNHHCAGDIQGKSCTGSGSGNRTGAHCARGQHPGIATGGQYAQPVSIDTPLIWQKQGISQGCTNYRHVR